LIGVHVEVNAPLMVMALIEVRTRFKVVKIVPTATGACVIETALVWSGFRYLVTLSLHQAVDSNDIAVWRMGKLSNAKITSPTQVLYSGSRMYRFMYGGAFKLALRP
jgi:hypothetical protein